MILWLILIITETLKIFSWVDTSNLIEKSKSKKGLESVEKTYWCLVVIEFWLYLAYMIILYKDYWYFSLALIWITILNWILRKIFKWKWVEYVDYIISVWLLTIIIFVTKWIIN